MTDLLTFSSTFGPEPSVWIQWCQPDASPAVYLFWLLLSAAALFNLVFGVYAIIRSITSASPTLTVKISVVIYICWMIAGSSYTYHIGQSIWCLSDFYEWMIVGIYPSFLYMVGLSLLYLLYLLRLRSIFNTTEYALSTCAFIAFLILFMVQIASPCFMAYYFLQNLWPPALNCYNVFLLGNLTANILLLCTFSRKIYLLGREMVKMVDNPEENITADKTHTMSTPDEYADTTSTKTSTYTSTGDTETEPKSKSDILSKSKSEEKTKFHLALKTLLTPSIRYILCAFAAMLSSNLLSILGFYRSYGPDNEILWAFHLTTMVFDQSINMICLYLQYSFSEKRYRKCCGKIHECIYNTVVKTIDHDHEALISEEYDANDMDNTDNMDNMDEVNAEITLFQDSKGNIVNQSELNEKMGMMEMEMESLIDPTNTHININAHIDKSKETTKDTTGTSGLDISTRNYIVQ